MVWWRMIEVKPTPSEIKARIRASKQSPKNVPCKCVACGGTGEVTSPGRHASRCPSCLGSGVARQSEDRQMDAFIFGANSR